MWRAGISIGYDIIGISKLGAFCSKIVKNKVFIETGVVCRLIASPDCRGGARIGQYRPASQCCCSHTRVLELALRGAGARWLKLDKQRRQTEGEVRSGTLVSHRPDGRGAGALRPTLARERWSGHFHRNWRKTDRGGTFYSTVLGFYKRWRR
ncbi:hypothetical protein RRG08_046960 [Elysia crispata]|uniref:Uncharacterized protein n=1 Tax=Elysia crispata TaxID=231223 RepID=A0AAE1DU54_9GAST|nr:hypothetical protein RRG08_046960 [Elysia crispata]